jgi:hypothetical protein
MVHSELSFLQNSSYTTAVTMRERGLLAGLPAVSGTDGW